MVAQDRDDGQTQITNLAGETGRVRSTAPLSQVTREQQHVRVAMHLKQRRTKPSYPVRSQVKIANSRQAHDTAFAGLEWDVSHTLNHIDTKRPQTLHAQRPGHPRPQPIGGRSDGSEPIDDPPAGFATWDEWRRHRWPPSVS